MIVFIWGEVIAQWTAYWASDPESLVRGEVIAQWTAYWVLDPESLVWGEVIAQTGWSNAHVET